MLYQKICGSKRSSQAHILFFLLFFTLLFLSSSKALETDKIVKTETGQPLAHIHVSSWLGQEKESFLICADADSAGQSIAVPVQCFKRDSTLTITPEQNVPFPPRNGIYAAVTSYWDTDKGLVPDTTEEFFPPTNTFQYIFNTYIGNGQADLYRMDFEIRPANGEPYRETLYYRIMDTSSFTGLELLSKNATVKVDDKAFTVESYVYQDIHYFSLRDVAKLLNGTDKQFDIGWDSVKNTVSLIPSHPYLDDSPFSTGLSTVKPALEHTLPISVNGQVRNIKAYLIEENNYIKLRDIGAVIGFDVGWDDVSQSILIDTKKPYTPAVPAYAPQSNLSTDGLLFPCPSYTRISGEYGYRVHPMSGTQKLHKGIDLAAPTGDPVLAAASGTVIKSYLSESFGNCIKIQHENGLQTLYAHMSSRLVKVGDVVTAGQKIGTVGATGNATGPHLHFEVHLDDAGQTADPEKYFSPAEVEKYITNHKKEVIKK